MTNKDISSIFKGKSIIMLINCHPILLDEGTVLIVDKNKRIESSTYDLYFQTAKEYKLSSITIKYHRLIDSTPGSVLAVSDRKLRPPIKMDPDNYMIKNLLLSTLRIPTDEELAWYEKQSIV